MKVDYNRRQPLEEQVYTILKDRIQRRLFSEGRLPPERELCGHTGVSRITVRGALARLEQEGFICKVQGKGTFVSQDVSSTDMPSVLTGTVGLLFPGSPSKLFSSDHYGQIANGILQEASEKGKKVTVCSGKTPAQTEDFIDMCAQGGVDGAVLLKIPHKDSISGVAGTGISCILVDEDSGGLIDSVDVDSFPEAVKAVDYLIQLGHRNIAYLDWLDPDNTNPGRGEGYREALKQAGIECRDDMVAAERMDEQGGYRAAEELLARGVEFTALFAFGDAMAVGAVRALQEKGFRIPEDISVMGYGGLVSREQSGIDLTTVKVDSFGMGIQAVTRLLYRIENPGIPPERIAVTGEIVPGGTVQRQ